LLEQLAGALELAHQHGVVHRDLKPANVLLQIAPGKPGEDGDQHLASRGLSGTPKVADFGLARRIKGGGGLTQTEAVLGTPSYMAPERAGGEGQLVGPSADIYALGAILYECLTGRPPIVGPTPVETVLRVLEDEPVAVRQLQPAVPQDLETICLKCLLKEAGKRYASAGALADDLRRFLPAEPILARPAGRLERGLKWVKRRPTQAGLVLALVLGVLALTGGMVGTTLGLARAREAEARAREERDRARAAERAADAERAVAQAVNRFLL